MYRRRLMMNGGFPREPSEYELISTYTSPATFVAPETGWFQIEVHGASGNGGAPYKLNYSARPELYIFWLTSGGGGGGGGYACSRVKLKKDDIITFSPGAVGAVSSASVYSTIEEYEKLTVTSGGNGGAASTETAVVGTGGIASGGNYKNANGSNGNYQHVSKGIDPEYDAYGVVHGYGGVPGCEGGNTGGNGEGCVYDTSKSEDDYLAVIPATRGSAGFIKIYRGDTN